MERVQIGTGHYLVALPDGNVYSQGQTADLTDDEFDQIRPVLFTDGTIIDLGPSPTHGGGTVVETMLFTMSTPTGPFTVPAPSGNAIDGHHMLMRIRSGSTGYAPTWNSIYTSSGVAVLPTAALPANKTTTFGFQYDTALGKWVLMAIDPFGY